MSTDLELLQDLSKIRLLTVKTRMITQSSNDVGEDVGGKVVVVEPQQNEDNGNNEECRTPTSEENKIPKILVCPPAPRKPRIRVPSCKRKLSELQFFEIANGEEVDAFFRSSFESVSDITSVKRNCCTCK